jgi:hypothetical protein
MVKTTRDKSSSLYIEHINKHSPSTNINTIRVATPTPLARYQRVRGVAPQSTQNRGTAAVIDSFAIYILL